jgi:hypothetical protein
VCWQGVAGGAEQGESAEQAARARDDGRSGVPIDAPLVSLDAVASVPGRSIGCLQRRWCHPRRAPHSIQIAAAVREVCSCGRDYARPAGPSL